MAGDIIHGALVVLKWLGIGIGALVAVVIVGAVAVPPLTRATTDVWGATRAEAGDRLPGDELVPDAQAQSTRAITIDAPVELVNELVRQQGYQRAGWHGWDWFYDATGSGGFVDGHYSTRVVPELQGIGVGDRVYINKMVSYEVVRDDRPGAFVLYGATGPDGEFIGPGEELPAKHSAMSWAWVARPDGSGGTRLILRIRSEMQGQGGFVQWLFDRPLDFGGALFAHKTLVGIGRTAEALAAKGGDR